jgi:hypothetical protein
MKEISMRRSLVLAAALAASILVPAADMAVAAGPTRVSLDLTYTLPASAATCTFPITVHVFGTFQFFTAADGSSKENVAHGGVTYTNPTSGKVLTSPLAGPVFTSTPNANGLVTVTIDGNDGRFTAPGQGVIFADVGQFVYLADPSNTNVPLVVMKSTGIQDPSPFPAVCGPLS